MEGWVIDLNDGTVSVVIPTHNRAHLLPRAIKSVLNQTFRDLELIVVDDGSTDETENVVRSFQKNDGRIRYVRHKENRGGNAARNTGVRNSRGRYIAFLDSDDEWLPEKLEKQRRVFHTTSCSNLGLVYGGEVVYENDRIIKKTPPKARGRVLERLLKYCFIESGSNGLILKEVFNSCGLFDEAAALRKGGNQDYEMWIRIAKRYDFDYVDAYLANQYLQKTSITTHKENNPSHAVESLMYLLGKHKKDYERHPSAHSAKLRLLAKWFFMEGNRHRARQQILKAIVLNPLTLRSYGFYIFAFLPKKHAWTLVMLKRSLLGRFPWRII